MIPHYRVWIEAERRYLGVHEVAVRPDGWLVNGDGGELVLQGWRVELFTGKKDADGTPIYFGDVVEVPFGSGVAAVQPSYDTKKLRWFFNREGSFPLVANMIDWGSSHIIGNIHDRGTER